MGIRQKALKELETVAVTTAYFAAWVGVLAVLKKVVLEEYHIPVAGLSLALLGALVIAKVVLVLEHVPLGPWVRRQPAAVDVLVRTLLYGVGVLIVLYLEKAIESRHEYGGLRTALAKVPAHPDVYHVWANAICLTCALLVFNALTVVRRHLGERQLMRLYMRPMKESARTGD